MRIKSIPLLAIVIFLLLTACQPSDSTRALYQQQLFTFGTLIDISIIGDNSAQEKQAINVISSEFDRLHNQWHPWENGALGQANAFFEQPASSKNTKNSAQFISTPSIIKLIKDSQLLSEKSNGLFNPAIGQLIKLWQFDQLENENYQFTPPSHEKIQNLITKHPKMMDIVVDNDIIKSNNSAVSLDFGAFAKGAAIEQIMSILKKNHIDNALINAGGDLKVLGSKNGKPWRIGIKNPAHTLDHSEKTIIAAIELHDNESLFTSGDYERFFEFQGKHYHHIIDPRTGYPAVGTKSVTILTEDAALADAASTALFIAGTEQWQEIAKKMGIQYVMLISDDNKIYLTPMMADRIELLTETQAIIVK